MGLTTLPCKNKIVEKPPRNSAGFCIGGQGLSWAVERRKEDLILLGSLSKADTHGMCSMFEEMMHRKFWQKNSEEINHLGVLHMDGRIA
jgi:hypothetical protein